MLQIELDEYLETFQSYKHRYKNDYEASYSDDQLYYSVDIGREPVTPLLLACSSCAALCAWAKL